jgi:alkanesulfonate monooxygenase SsuD/methylene tetrahydromethanopterin reductase-like flavin-dependent oxidoreductase (luciferase family)
MEIGLYTFAELADDPATGRSIGAAQRIKDLIEEAELAEQVGLDVFGVGEHHRPDFAVSTPAVALPRSLRAPSASASRAPSRC